VKRFLGFELIHFLSFNDFTIGFSGTVQTVAFIVFQELFRQWHLLFFRNCSDSGIYCFSGTVQTVSFIVFQELFRQWHLLFFRNCSDSGIYCFSGTVQTVAAIM
jgi:hypothetical protein